MLLINAKKDFFMYSYNVIEIQNLPNLECNYENPFGKNAYDLRLNVSNRLIRRNLGPFRF